MKIYIVGSAHPLRGGGISTFNERLAEVLQNEGHDVTIISYKKQYPSLLFPGKSQYTDEPAPKGLKIRSLIHSYNPFNWLKVGRILQKEKPDVIVSRYWLPFFGPCLGTIHRIVRKNKHTKIIALLDNVIPHEHRIGDKAFTNYFLPSVQGFITMSKEVMADVKKFNATQPIEFAPHPMYDNYGTLVPRQESLNQLNLSPDFSYLLFFGFIRDYKGLDLLLEALPLVKNQQVKLIVAGEFYNNKATYEQIIQKNKLEDKLILHTDFIPNDQVSLYFSAADVVVQPYRTATQSGISQIAYYFQKPMIVTNVGGLPEIVPNGKVGYVVAPQSAAIAQAIDLFYSEEKQAFFQQNIAEERKKYEWFNFTNKLISLANKI
ncbi:MAG: glycosyltransferase [Crocinitomicaceae bacterium]